MTDNSTTTRLARVIQQLKAFDLLHADELEAMAEELDLAGFTQLATRLQAAEAERLKRPLSRRGLLGRVSSQDQSS